MKPRYQYKVNPGQLAQLVNFIDSTRGTDAALIEVGVAQGDTSVFLLEHLKTTGDPRPLICMDTFSGFTDESIQVEIDLRGKEASDEHGAFEYGDQDIFRRNLESLGYSNFEIVEGDASAFDWQSFGSIGCVLLDIDLYQPTKEILDAAFPLLAPGGGIVVDDCLPDTTWDGSLQAYEEFIVANGMEPERAGEKGAVVRGAVPTS